MKIAESALRGLIREVLLLEAARTVEDFIAAGGSARVGTSRFGKPGLTVELFTTADEVGMEASSAAIVLSPPHPSTKAYGGPCHPAGLPPAWEVKWSRARGGLGPLLYDIALEGARILGASVASDRDEVSPDAQRVWAFYDRNRPDVVKGQLDDEGGTLTPDIGEDDCSQWMSKSIAADAGDPAGWHGEPISRAFTVPAGGYPRLRALHRQGALRAPPAIISALGG